MSEEKNDLDQTKQELENSIDPLTKLLVSDVFAKNNITEDKKRNLTEGQKQAILDMVQNLQKQANEFVERSNQKKLEALEKEKAEAQTKRRRRTTLRERVKQRKTDQE
ncbi:spore coat protein [Bacillus amyloliquefaciens]|uniref:spore coat protein n=1 Tax=Bacillus amyloliquefaciens TaxID=1390 RepID=UPI0018722177|nr:spore coat protein [Bacillus amyloliquefaciens]QOQ56137.1 spore coat protein [Bacillus amyloliquefaciens]